MEFKRTYFIKDLYNLEEIYSSFRSLHFDNVEDFLGHLSNGYLFKGQEYVVNVRTSEDVMKLGMAYDMNEGIKESVLVFNVLAEEAVDTLLMMAEELKIFKNTIMAFDYELGAYLVDEIGGEPYYCLENTTRLNGLYKADDFFVSYKKDMGLMLRAHWQRMRYRLKFDYASFEDAPLNVLHVLKFVCNQVYIFTSAEVNTELTCIDSEYEKKSGTRKLTLLNTDNVLEAYVNNLGEIFLDEGKTICYLTDPTKEKSLEERSKIRSLIDIQFNSGVSPINGYFINLDENIKIMRDVYNVPYVSVMVDRWLRGVEL